MSRLISLPHEILHNVFVETHPIDLAALSLTCRVFSVFIRKNRCLFRELYLKTFVGHHCVASGDPLTGKRMIGREKAKVMSLLGRSYFLG